MSRHATPWRLACPECGGRSLHHVGGESIRGGHQRPPAWVCEACRQRGDDHHYEHVIDLKTNATVPAAQ